MKKIITICLLIATVFSVKIQAQNTPFNKQQTLDYIDRVFKLAYSFDDLKVKNVSLQGNILNVSFTNGNNETSDLLRPEPLEVGLASLGYNVRHSEYFIVLWCIRTETDAKRLKKALEHLIEILKQEKEADPFGE